MAGGTVATGERREIRGVRRSCGLAREYGSCEAQGALAGIARAGGSLPLLREGLAKFGRLGAEGGVDGIVAQLDAHIERGITHREAEIHRVSFACGETLDGREHGFDGTLRGDHRLGCEQGGGRDFGKALLRNNRRSIDRRVLEHGGGSGAVEKRGGHGGF